VSSTRIISLTHERRRDGREAVATRGADADCTQYLAAAAQGHAFVASMTARA